MSIVFSCLQKWAGFSDGDFRDDGTNFAHVGPETANARENTTCPQISLGALVTANTIDMEKQNTTAGMDLRLFHSCTTW